MNTQQRRLAAAAASFGAAMGMIGGAGHAMADPAVVTEAQTQAGQPGSAQPGMPTADAGQETGSSQPGMPESGDATADMPAAGSGSAAPTSAVGTSQPGMPESSPSETTSTPPVATTTQPGMPESQSSTAPPAETGTTAPQPAAPPASGSQTPVPSAGPATQDVPATPSDDSGTVAPITVQNTDTTAQPGMPVTDPAPAPAPTTIESVLQQQQSPDFPQVQAPPQGTDRVVDAHQQDLPGGGYINIPRHVIPDATYASTPLQENGQTVGTVEQGTVGSSVGVSASNRVDASSITSAGVVDVGPNTVGVAQQGDMSGSYQGAAATSGTDAGYGTGYVTNTPLVTDNGSTATASGQWTAPGGGASIQVNGQADFRSMQVPSVSGGITVNTPWGNFQTPPIP